MEILSGDDKLVDEILKDARTRADRVIKKAALEVEALKDKQKSDIAVLEKEILANTALEIEKLKEKNLSGIEIDFQKMKWKYTGDFFNSVFQDLKNRILQDRAGYSRIYHAMVMEAISIMKSSQVIITAGAEEASLLDKNAIDSQCKKNRIEVSYETSVSKGVTVFSSDRKTGVHVTLDALLEDLEKSERNRIYEIYTRPEDKK